MKHLQLLLLLCCPFWLNGQADVLADSAYAAADREDYAYAANLLLRAAKQENKAAKAAEYLLDAGDAYRYAEKTDSALYAYSELTAYPSTGEVVDSLRALAFHLTGLLHYRQKDYTASLEPYAEAIEIRDRLYPQGHNDRAKTRFNIASSYYRMGDFDKAESWWQESNLLYEQLPHPDSMRWLRTLLKLSENYWNLNDPHLVRSVVLRAVPIFRTYYQNDTFKLGSQYYAFGANLSNMGSPDLMVDMMDSAAYYYQLADSEYELVQSIHARATSHMEKGDFKTARHDLNDVLERLGEPDEYDELYASAYYNAALVNLELNDFGKAERKGKQALEGYQALEDSVNIVGVLHLLARTAGETGKAALAHQYFKKAFQLLLDQDVTKIDPETINPAHLTIAADLLYDRAEQHIREQQYTEALEDYNYSFALIDRIRQELSTEESQSWVSSNARPFYQRAIGLYYKRYQQTEDDSYAWKALALSERSKAFSLLLAIRRAKYERPRRERELQRNIVQLERSKRAEDKTELGRLRLELERLKEMTVQPVEELTPFDREKLIDYLLTRNQTLLEFALGKDDAYRFLLLPSGKITFDLLPSEAEIAAMVRKFRESIKRSAYKKISLDDNQADLDVDFEVASADLSKKLFGKATNTIASQEKLLIIPDGVLGFLPFGALLTKEVKDVPLDYTSLPYLQNGRQIAYGYSTAFLLELAQREKTNCSENLLAFAPIFKGDPATNQTGQDQQRSLPALLPLRYNEAEVNAVTNLIPWSNAYLGQAANREQFEKSARDYRMLLISSHALVNAENPNLSFIAFSQRGDSLETDEMLFLNDLSTLQLPTELAVLSACETSMGKVVPGEGVLSLARAFAAAGAASTLTTLWKVDDEATKEFTVAFFEALKANQSRSEAVVAAQNAGLSSEDFAHPYYWSAMTLYGESGPVDIRPSFALNQNSVYTLVAVGCLLLLVAFVLFRKRQASK